MKTYIVIYALLGSTDFNSRECATREIADITAQLISLQYEASTPFVVEVDVPEGYGTKPEEPVKA